MTSVQRKRFIRYANFMNRLPVKHFNLNMICSAGLNPIHELLDEENSCGTTACALGHLPVFNPRVFVFRRNGYLGRWGNYGIGNKKTGCSDSFETAEEYFGITQKQLRDLFEPKSYPVSDWNNPKAVAAKMYKILGVKVPA